MGGTGTAAPPKPSPSDALELSRQWSKAMLSDLKICPYTYSADAAGLPPGPVRYAVFDGSTAESVYAAYWNEIALVQQSTSEELSTTLLITPNFMPEVGSFYGFSKFLQRSLLLSADLSD